MNKMVEIGYEICVPNSTSIKYNPVFKENVVFIEWLKYKNVYDEFIRIADLCELSKEQLPEEYFTCLDWDDIEDDYDMKKYKIDWDLIVCEWLKYISIRDWNFITTGISPNDYKNEILKRNVIEKIKNINFNKLTNAQFKKLNQILK